MKKIFLVVVLCFIGLTDYACLNEFITRSDGHSTEGWSLMRNFYRGFDQDFSQKFVDSYDLTQKDSIPFNELSDVAIHLAKLARYEESLSLLLWLYQRHPDNYRVTANLGTLYELNGNNDSAYYFIEESMKLNPGSHEGTEWVHLSILKAKMKMEKNPGWIYEHRVINLYYQEALDPDSKITYAMEDSISAILYQMEERIPFSPTPDPLVANIFNEVGDLLAEHYSVVDAYIAYLISSEYDPENRFGSLEKSTNMKSLLKKENAEIPKLSRYFKIASDFEDIKDAKLPNNTPQKPITDMPIDIGGKPNPADTSYAWLTWVCIGAVVALLGGVIFFARKKS